MTTTAGSYAKPRIGIQLNLISCFSSLGVRRWPVSQAWLVMAAIFCVGVLMRRWVMEVDGSLTSRPRQPVDSTIHHKLATHSREPSSNPHHLARLCKLHWKKQCACICTHVYVAMVHQAQCSVCGTCSNFSTHHPNWITLILTHSLIHSHSLTHSLSFSPSLTPSTPSSFPLQMHTYAR